MAELYPWFQPQFSQMLSLIKQQQLAHALVLCGQDGIGKSALADALAAVLLCKNRQSDGACGQCKSCLLRHAGNHADLLHLRTDTQHLGVDAIRQLNNFTQGAAQQHGNRVAIIPKADSMTEAAANALLKTLEEPPAGCFIVLVTSNYLQLSATIRSRCQQWQLSAANQTDTAQWLSTKITKPPPAFLLEYCQGAPLKALSLLENGTAESLSDTLRLLDEYFNGKLLLSAAVKQLDGQAELSGLLSFYIRQRLAQPLAFLKQQAVLTAYQRWCRDATRIIGQNSALALTDLLTELKTLLQHPEAKWKS
ncbi:DNA polymerase III subunit delta' [Arsukibacterium indicum]|uniref:DNA polymerase III subunit delta n=1 Tax=Arsukibacterium indicum TaxID=2848612 RepID=A0ABS6MJG8_9GAMM|nr:DNA polymerase III subunit delta' [Arsukibacterium indicum]MBV2128372.1 DNA polymerase III subunit delta' [Arsukibacterium indicum]